MILLRDDLHISDYFCFFFLAKRFLNAPLS